MPSSTKIAAGQPYALQGRVVTMDGDFRVLERGRVYVDAQGVIAAVTPLDAPVPPDFAGVPVVLTGGTIYPGLIELHNHLSYNILRLWDVPEKYTDRNVWRQTEAYKRDVSGPLCVLGRTKGYPEAIARYAECKCLMGGVTTSQGVTLFSRSGIVTFYKGVVRNVEMRGPGMPPAGSFVEDVSTIGAEAFLRKLREREDATLFVHLSEGTDSRTHGHYQALQLPGGEWAMTRALVGIHCVALKADDFKTLKRHDASMVWSPLSNLLLYGRTARIKSAKRSGVRIALGSDWSPSGSKNLLGELKVAYLCSKEEGGVFTERELVAMATRNAAEVLRWDSAVGSIEAGKLADLLVINGMQGDPYSMLINARETSINLVTIGGVPRYGNRRLMDHFKLETESWPVGNTTRLLNLEAADDIPVVGELSLREAFSRLEEGMQNLTELAEDLASRDLGSLDDFDEMDEPEWTLVLDQQEPESDAVLGGLIISGEERDLDELGDAMRSVRGAQPCRTEGLPRLSPDPLTVAGDPIFLRTLRKQRNLPDFVKQGLAQFYR